MFRRLEACGDAGAEGGAGTDGQVGRLVVDLHADIAGVIFVGCTDEESGPLREESLELALDKVAMVPLTVASRVVDSISR